MSERTTVLLGAGASVDAGLPLTFQLANRLIARANEPHRRQIPYQDDWIGSLNFVYGAMVGYQAEDGSDPLQAVNIERLISALRLLQTSKEHEVAPFVASWKVGALGLGTPEVDGSLGSPAIQAMKAALGDHSLAAPELLTTAVAAIAKAAFTGSNPTAFARAENEILDGLGEILGEIKTVKYLYPLGGVARSQSGGLDVITLNYDLTVERMVDELQGTIDRGIERWVPGEPLTFARKDGQINLYKLHGSLDWALDAPSGRLAPPVIKVSSTPNEADDSGRLPRPWIVVGDREKLATDGPTLALLRAAEDALVETTNLVVVGYSFGDPHINTILRNWMATRDGRTITILDNKWEEKEPTEGFRNDLISTYGANLNSRIESRVTAIQGTTAVALKSALAARPLPVPEEQIRADIKQTGRGEARILINSVGAELRNVRLYFRQTNGTGVTNLIDAFTTHKELLAFKAGVRDHFHPTHTVRLPRLNEDGIFDIYVIVPNVQNISIQVSGRRLDSREDLLVEIAPVERP